MADKKILLDTENGLAKLLLVDQNDGTYRLGVDSGATGGSGGGGGAATIADGADVAEGAKANAPASSTDAEDTTARTGISLWKGIKNILLLLKTSLSNIEGVLPSARGANGGIKVEGVAGGVVVPVSGTVTASGPLTDAQLRNSAVPMSLAVLPALVAGEAHAGEVGGHSVVAGDEFTRPADTTAYTAGDAVSATTSDTGTTALRSLTVARKNGGSGTLSKFRLVTDQVANVASYRIHFYTKAAPDAAVVGDNVAMTIKYLNKANRLGHVDMPAMSTSTVVGSSDCAISQELDVRFDFVCDPADTKIYYRIETLTGFTPNNGQKYYLEATSQQD